MMQVFIFRTETNDNTYHQTIYSIDKNSIVSKWITNIEDLQDQPYSFSKKQVQEIRTQYLNGDLQIQIDKKPYFLTYKSGDKYQVVKIDKQQNSNPDFIAQITYLTKEEGGRQNYAASGYRSHFKFDGSDYLTSGEQLFIDKDKAHPGDTVTAEVRILSVDYFKNLLFVGQHFQIGEASHTVGYGEILEVINSQLLKASR